MNDIDQAEISVIVVNYGTADLAVEAVESILTLSHGGRTVDVHLVDNASPGEDAARLAEVHTKRDWGDRVTLYLETTNHGFGRGNNLVLRALANRLSPPEKVFLLNPDAKLKNEALKALADFLDSHPRVGLAGAQISRPGQGPVTAAFRFPSLASEIDSTVCFGPISRILRHRTVALPPEIPTSRVDWVSGAAVMFRFRALAEIGFFDPDYFLYYEEVDLMRRFSRAGWETWHVAEARAIHIEGAATQIRNQAGVRLRRPRYWYESRRLYFVKNHGQAYALLIAGLVTLAGIANHGIAALRGRPSGLPLNFLLDYQRFVLQPLLGRRR